VGNPGVSVRLYNGCSATPCGYYKYSVEKVSGQTEMVPADEAPTVVGENHCGTEFFESRNVFHQSASAELRVMIYGERMGDPSPDGSRRELRELIEASSIILRVNSDGRAIQISHTSTKIGKILCPSPRNGDRGRGNGSARLSASLPA